MSFLQFIHYLSINVVIVDGVFATTLIFIKFINPTFFE